MSIINDEKLYNWFQNLKDVGELKFSCMYQPIKPKSNIDQKL